MWKDIKNFEGLYQVSDVGEVRSLDRFIVDTLGRRRLMRGRVLASYNRGKGYRAIALSRDSFTQERLVHDLVAEQFIGPRPRGLEIAHNNGVPDDNRVSNLRYATRKENAADMKLHGTYTCGEAHHNYVHGAYCK